MTKGVTTLKEEISQQSAALLAQWDPSAAIPAERPPVPRRVLAKSIDHTLLKPEATPAMVMTLCDEAVAHGFAAVCVHSAYVPLCAERLRGTGVAVASVAGFPFGANLTEVKAYEANKAIEAGATEIDMVLAVGRLKAGDLEAVYEDIAAVVEVCHRRGALCKVILETALLTEMEKVKACLLAVRAGADFVKTSTGFGPGGATPADVALMRYVVGPTIGVKAAGGIRTYEDAVAMISAGATRIGASAGVHIIEGAPET